MPQPQMLFKKIEIGEIFTGDFRNFQENNIIDFSNEGIAVVYGPNGSGKTSLVNVLSGKQGTNFLLEYDGIDYSTGEVLFYIINDQNNRNIIFGTAKDFLLGDNIKKEYELQEYIAKEYLKLCTESIATLKTNFNISTASSKLIELIKNADLIELIKDLANNKSKGTKTIIPSFIKVIEGLKGTSEPQYDSTKFDFFIKDCADKSSTIQAVLQIKAPDLIQNSQVREIEENTEALKILTHFSHKSQCVVCDTPDIDPAQLIERKTKNKEAIIGSLNKEMRALIEKTISITPESDPFGIKEALLQAIDTGDLSFVILLKNDILLYIDIFNALVKLSFITLLSGSELSTKSQEYEKMIIEKPEIAEEDFLYIEEIINNSMNKKLRIDRDEKKNIKILLSDKEFLDKERNELPLSAGEQNFLSLTFEFLKAKNSPSKIVVLDDPISSFDSIYKNKVAFAIVKMLQHKQRIILTHNIDLLRLLDGQYKKCFKLYLLNNTDGEENGFVALKSKEQDILINLEQLLNTFRKDIFSHIIDVELFLISMIPFMRGYAMIINNSIVKDKLTQLMHGYKTETVNIAQIYQELFQSTSTVIPTVFDVSVEDILKRTVDGAKILNTVEYPLLDKTLKHSFTYLFLRLLVEKTLVTRYVIDTNQYKQLDQIISQAFPSETDIIDIRNKVSLTSKKTLINEFNHFEGNLSIFQPAIDITDHALGNEKTNILAFISKIKT